MSTYRHLFVVICTSLAIMGSALAADTAQPTVVLDALTASPTALERGKSVHVSANLTVNANVASTGLVRVRVIDSNNVYVKEITYNFTKLTAGQKVTISGDYVVPTNAPLGSYSLSAQLWTPGTVAGWAYQWGIFTVNGASLGYFNSGDPKSPVTISNPKLSASKISTGEVLTIDSSIVSTVDLPSPGYVQVGVYNSQWKQLESFPIYFKGLKKGVPVGVTGKYTVPSSLASGSYFARASAWSFDFSAANNNLQSFTVASLPVVAGTCGSANGQTVSVAPTANLCGSGLTPTVSLNTDGKSWKWSCAGTNGGATASCSATKAGYCGTADGKTFSATPRTNLCASGTAGNLALLSGKYSWACPSGGTSTVTCGANYSAPALMVSAYTGPGPEGYTGDVAFGKWLGREVDHYMDMLNMTSWKDLRMSASWAFAAYPKDKRFIVGIPMLVQQDSSGTYWEGGVKVINAKYPKGTLKDGADGKLDAHFIYVAEQLIKYGHADAIIRLGWEMNGNWMPWRAKADPESYKKFFAHVVTIMKAVPGAKFEFDWNPGVDTNEINPELAYPGDAYVDYIGIDIYDNSWSKWDVDPTTRWNLHYNTANGIKWWIDFANAHGKKKSIPEWGTGDATVGDNALFVKNMAKVIKENNVAYMDYWDSDSAYTGKLSTNARPKAGAEFLKQFGGAVAP